MKSMTGMNKSAALLLIRSSVAIDITGCDVEVTAIFIPISQNRLTKCDRYKISLVLRFLHRSSFPVEHSARKPTGNDVSFYLANFESVHTSLVFNCLGLERPLHTVPRSDVVCTLDRVTSQAVTHCLHDVRLCLCRSCLHEAIKAWRSAMTRAIFGSGNYWSFAVVELLLSLSTETSKTAEVRFFSEIFPLGNFLSSWLRLPQTASQF